MLKSMYSGISGMKANQTKMDVVGNNVANVGTTAFKKSSTRFTDALNQTIIYSSAPSGGIGGVNPGQVGIGTKVSGIFKSMSQGSLQPTGRPTDLAIDGDGFFVIDMNGTEAYTRDGSFSLDAEGNIVTADGYKVKGYSKDPDGDGKGLSTNLPTTSSALKIPKTVEIGTPVTEKQVISFNISKNGSVSLTLDDGSKVDEYARVGVAVFQNPEGMEALSGNLYGQSANSGRPTHNIPNIARPDDELKHGLINQGAIEMSNVDLSEEFTEMIITTRAFQAASKVITTSDELLQEIINLKR